MDVSENNALPRLPEMRPLVQSAQTFSTVTEKISSIVLRKETPRSWYVGLVISFLLVMLLLLAVTYLFVVGVGIWGINVPVAWGFAIVNFVWWIGIGHAGTLISAVLLLLHQNWRTSINRFAEAMTLFAVACAGLFPILHLGRPRFFYWLVPYPATTGMWPQFRSPLVWDFFAISTYATVSLLFWYMGLIPDLATLRDRTSSRLRRIVYGFLAMGWRGSARHWKRYHDAYLLMAGLATPLVVSVHSIVSFDFSVGNVPGWHSTIFPPYFVAGAIYSGFAMVLTIAIPLRSMYKLEDLVTDRHLDNMAKVMLASGMIVAYGYIVETFMAWYSGNVYEQSMMLNRMAGPYACWYWLLITCNLVIPQLLWFRSVRDKPICLFVLALVINLGMWLERFVIVVVSLHRDFMPSSWGMYYPTFWDWATLFGSLGLFVFLLLLFIRFLPMISIAEMRELLEETKRGETVSKTPSSPRQPMEPVAPDPFQKSFGLLVSFRETSELLSAVTAARDAGYENLEAYSPFPIEGLAESLGFHRSRIPLVVLIGGMVGCVSGFLLAYYCSAVAYPHNVGGRPYNSWQAFIPVTFEVTILIAAFAAVLGMFALNGLPRPHHPLFSVSAFDRATQDRFFLFTRANDPKFESQATRTFLEQLGGEGVYDVYD